VVLAEILRQRGPCETSADSAKSSLHDSFIRSQQRTARHVQGTGLGQNHLKSNNTCAWLQVFEYASLIIIQQLGITRVFL
jgi:hypothetical protein